MTDTADTREAEPVVDPDQHAAHRLNLTPLPDWYSWRLRWDNPDCWPQERLGLLHCAFDVSCRDPEDAADRLCLLLELADDDPARGMMISDHRERQRAEMAQQLSRKALSVLADHYFKDGSDAQEGELRWLSMLELPGVLEKTIWFFRTNRFGSCSNLSRSKQTHQAKQTRQFASRLWKLCWDYDKSKLDGKGRWRSLYAGEQEFFEQLKACRVRLLHLALLLAEEDTLINNEHYRLDFECNEYLLDLAMRPKMYGHETTQPDSLEQAFLFGSTAARVLILNHIADLERDRLAAIKLAERVARDNEARLAALRRGPQPDAALPRGPQSSNLDAEIARQLDED